MNSFLTHKKKWLICKKNNEYLKKNKNICFNIFIFFISNNYHENNQEFNNLCCWK